MKHRLSVRESVRQLLLGTKYELDQTKWRRKARRLAQERIDMDPEYYTRRRKSRKRNPEVSESWYQEPKAVWWAGLHHKKIMYGDYAVPYPFKTQAKKDSPGYKAALKLRRQGYVSGPFKSEDGAILESRRMAKVYNQRLPR